MTVGELIAHLQTFDASMPVVGITCGQCDDEGDIDADNVRVGFWEKGDFGWNAWPQNRKNWQEVLVIR